MAVTDNIGSLRQYGNRFVNGFTTGQKAMTILAVIALAFGGLFYSKFVASPSYAPLFTGLAPTDAAAMTSKLQASSIPYQLADGGATILVPQPDVFQQRLNMAQAGLPANSTVGLSILDKVGITSSQITQQADYQRALQGELASTIEAIQGVTSAQVNLALVSNDVFAISNNQAPSASVLVTLAPGATLSSGQVQGIVHLVASSIPNLTPANVTLVDQNGNVLAAPGMDTSASSNSTATDAYNQALETSLQGMLASLVGANNAVVRVNATLNFNQVTTQSQTVQTSPNGTPVTAPTQVQTATQNFAGVGSPTGGVLGGITTGAASNSTYKQTNNTTSYALGQTNQTVTQAPGQVQHLSVAVLMNSKVKGVSPAQVRQLVAAAAGIVASRGDVVSVVQMPFSTVAAKQAAVAAAAAQAGNSTSSLFSLLKTLLLVLGILGVLFLIFRTSRREVRSEIPIAALNATGDEELMESYIKQLPPAEAPILSDDVVDFIEAQPDDVAKLLRVWMTSTSKVG